MAALVSGYDSAEDEAPMASTSTLPKLGNGYNGIAVDDDEDDEDDLEEQARADAFGLASRTNGDSTREEKRTEVSAAPDVLREVSLEIPSPSQCSVGSQWSRNGHHSSTDG